MESTGSFSISFISTLLFALCLPALSYKQFEGGIIMWRAVEPYSDNTEVNIEYIYIYKHLICTSTSRQFLYLINLITLIYRSIFGCIYIFNS